MQNDLPFGRPRDGRVAVIDNASQYISFQGPESNDNWLPLTESNLFKRGSFLLSIRWK